MWVSKGKLKRNFMILAITALSVASCSGDGSSETITVASGTAGDSVTTASPTTATTTSVSEATIVTETTPSSEADSTTTADVTTTSLASGQPVTGPVFVVGSNYVLGWWDGTSWVETDGDGEQVPALRGHILRSVSGNEQILVGEDPIVGCFPEDSRGTWWSPDLMPGVGVTGTHDLQPRPIEEVAPAPAHYDAVREVLDRDGVDAEVEINRVIRFDLEGDGTDEVIIEANRLDGTPIANLGPGNYSIVLYRRVRPDSTVENIVIHADTRPPPLNTADSLTIVEFEGLADVNGNGIFELATSYYGYEWGGSNLWDLTSTPTRVLGSGCGV